MKTVSLQLAKQLKEAGFPQDAYFYWLHYNEAHGGWKITGRMTDDWRRHILQLGRRAKGALVPMEIIAAPTAEEILELLPPRVQFKKKVKKNPDWSIDFIPEDELEELKHAGFLTISNPNRWCVNYLSNACFGVQNMAEVFYGYANLVNAAAKCWLYLKENHLLKTDTNEDKTQV